MQFLLTNQAKWYRMAVFGLLFMILPTILQSGWDAYWKHYYRTADISNFYEGVSFEASNICVGDLTQNIDSVRYVKGTDTGWAADIVRELYVVKPDKKSKVFDKSATVFIELIPDGKNSRQAAIPEGLEVGTYQWEITIIRLYLPYDVVRVATPSLVSNLFAVEECNNK